MSPASRPVGGNRGPAPRVRFTRAELDGFRGVGLPDLIGPAVRLLFVGANPGLRSAATQTHFVGGNRFFPALFEAGITDRRIDASNGLSAADRQHLIERGVGIASLVTRATATIDELSSAELTAGATLLATNVARIRPAVVAITGITTYRIAFERPRAALGRQPEPLAGCSLWVVPNPSGRNAHAPVSVLARAYREVAIAAGIPIADA